MPSGSKLWIILAKLSDPEIPLKEVKELWFEAKGIITNLTDPNEYEIEVSFDTLEKVNDRVDNFFTKWQSGEIQPTDEELDLLEEAFNEASWTFNFLVTNFSFSSEANERLQNKIKENKKIVGEEKDKREKIKNLQNQINSLQNQSNNNDNEERIRDLQRQIQNLKNKPLLPNSDTPPSQKSNDNSLLIVICIGLGVFLIVLAVGFLIFTKKRKSNYYL